MSMPTFPIVDPPIKVNDALCMILVSIAMEELGLSHIINAEGEKLQYVLGTSLGGSDHKPSVEEVLAVNKSVKSLLDSVLQNQALLKGKMECAIDALEDSGYCPTGATGPAGPPGKTGPTGATGPKGESGGSCSCSAICFPGRPEQCWNIGKPLLWVHSDCSECRCLYLSSDGKSVILKQGKCYAVSFTLDLCTPKQDNRVSISVQTIAQGKRIDRFIYHAPVNYAEVPFTVSAAGIFVSTCSCDHSTELAITLQSPDMIKVKQASLCVMEI